MYCISLIHETPLKHTIGEGASKKEGCAHNHEQTKSRRNYNRGKQQPHGVQLRCVNLRAKNPPPPVCAKLHKYYRVAMVVWDKLSAQGRYGCYIGPESNVCAMCPKPPWSPCTNNPLRDRRLVISPAT